MLERRLALLVLAAASLAGLAAAGSVTGDGEARVAAAGGMSQPALRRVRFEVFGRVQGVWFRKYTRKTALELGVAGWVQNTERGTVIGEGVGAPPRVAEFVEWLGTTGSPQSRVERLELHEDERVDETEWRGFVIDREYAK